MKLGAIKSMKNGVTDEEYILLKKKLGDKIDGKEFIALIQVYSKAEMRKKKREKKEQEYYKREFEKEYNLKRNDKAANFTVDMINGEKIQLSDLKGKVVLLNFWATWCAPCKEEMPSLDVLKTNPNLDNIEIFPINIGNDNLKKSNKFFEDLDIKNLNIFFDNPTTTLAKDFALRGLPTTILFNKNGKEFAKIIGSIDFGDKKFLQWIKQYN